jgi:hypothetical protein
MRKNCYVWWRTGHIISKTTDLVSETVAGSYFFLCIWITTRDLAGGAIGINWMKLLRAIASDITAYRNQP